MKKVFLSITLIAIAASCTSEMVEGIGTPAPDIMATYDNGGLTKTTLTTDEEGVGTIWWKPADQINIFYGTTSTKYTSTNTEDATTVVFSTTDVIGSTESASTNRWGLYPYDANATCNGSSVTTTIPTNQHGVAGTFDNDLFTSLAHSENNMMTFYNVCGGIKFSLSREDIQSITFKGNNNENIAGKVSLSMDGNDMPAVEIVTGEKVITLTPKTGATFAKNTNYYIVMLPTVLSNGFTMTFETETQIGTFEYNTKAVEIKRSVFGKKENVDSYAEFEDKTIIAEYVDLGLSVKWATCNLGASKPEEYGGYYQWAGIEDVSNTTINLCWEYCPYHSGAAESKNWTKYINSSYPSYWSGTGDPDNKYILDPEDDIVHITFGSNWRMPTNSEFTELINNCTSVWTDDYKGTGIKGLIFTSNVNGYTNNCIFFPAAGYRYYTYLWDDGVYGHYWASQGGGLSLYYSRCLIFNNYKTITTDQEYRFAGMTVRPVCE